MMHQRTMEVKMASQGETMIKPNNLEVNKDSCFAVIGDVKWENCSPAKKLLEEIIEKSIKCGVEVPQKVYETKEKIIEHREFPDADGGNEYFFYKPQLKLMYIVAVKKDTVSWLIPED